ncbi:ferritin family protein [Candidatus Woesearchaeota archaeon]|nr:ferritin family protein [Candidatus Woesearchaeota archaeon]
MTMNDNQQDKAYLHNEEEAVKMAIEKEIAVQKFYRENAEKMKMPLAKKAFEFLASQEKKHEEAIKKFNSDVLKGNNPDVSIRTMNTEKMKEFLGQNLENVREKFTASKDEIRIYELAKDRELTAYNFYKQSASEATHENVRHLFTFLTHEEDGHYHLLANMISYFSNPEGYFQDQEDWFFEG